MESIASLITLMRCHCGNDLHIADDGIMCISCGMNYGKPENRFFNYSEADKSEETVAHNPDGLIAQIKYFFKKFPKIYFFLAYILGGRQVNTTAQKFVSKLKKDLVIVNVGSGTKSLREDVIDVDFFPFPNVRIVAQAEELPFRDASVDVVVCDNVLEHIKNPGVVVEEMKRVVKKGGMVYIGVPFIIQYHSSPNDFQRWTTEGLRELMSDFEQIELKVACGPTSAMTTILAEWLAIALSFNITFLYNIFILIFTIIFTPIRLLDFIFSHYKQAENIAYGFYFIGAKK